MVNGRNSNKCSEMELGDSFYALFMPQRGWPVHDALLDAVWIGHLH